MNRDQRVNDNWALLEAQAWAKKAGVAFAVAHNLVPNFLRGGARQWQFKVSGLKEVSEALHKKGIPFYLFIGKDSHLDLATWAIKQKIGGMVTDFFPLRLPSHWVSQVVKRVPFPIHQVDAHNIIPCWITSPKQEFAARTIRPKIHAKLSDYLTDFPSLKKQSSHAPFAYQSYDWKKIEALCPTEDGSSSIDWIEPGEQAASKALKKFIKERLTNYGQDRNDPMKSALSDLSPYFHYGHLSPQRAAWEVRTSSAPILSRDAYLEELIVRRELSDNFCFYQPNYDSFEGLPEWAKKTLDAHRKDTREFLYTYKEFERGKTHDTLWNAAQYQLTSTGKMHGYMRMYWAKKILEWTKSPEEAFEIAIRLNDTYELDGRDPNGYVGVAWSIGGLHDRAWFPHPVFGTVRFMSRGGCEKKFDVDAYIKKWSK